MTNGKGTAVKDGTLVGTYTFLTTTYSDWPGEVRKLYGGAGP